MGEQVGDGDDRYVNLVYNESRTPLTDYPQKLAENLIQRFSIDSGALLLDIGCGRGEVLRGFIDRGLVGHGVDQSRAAEKYCPEADLRICDLETQPLPFPDHTFDVVYSKSVIEHFYHPENLVAEISRVLRPNGLAITLTPDWDTMYRVFYEDFTHRTPFTLQSLEDIFSLHGFADVHVHRFRQLPSTWKHPKLALPLAELTRSITPWRLKSKSKWIRFSKEIMLLGSARKPSG